MKPLLIISLVFGLVFSQADGALAARSGGRVGGGSFRRSAPPSYSAPSRAPSGGYYPGGGGYYPGGGFGFPFLLPFFFLVRSFRSAQMGGTTSDGYGGYTSISPNVSVSKLQVGLLSEARSLQSDLDRIAKTADTSTSAGLTLLLQETTLSLLRHPEYWQYAGSDTKQASLDSAEDLFNRFSLAERSKFTEE
ncbi:MAG: DUF1517 domain-containing protein, partial [Oculatellaceae cyanobacterium Prado106]|nr:DUF1517 domain-containing protein [Oculatellaceae cyanobacterium Prado106]